MLDQTMRARRDARADDAVRVATAGIRGAAMAATTAAVSVRDQLPALASCAEGGAAELDQLHADLLRYRRRLSQAASEVSALERAELSYPRTAPAGAPLSGWHVPAVAAARDVVDRTTDLVTLALQATRDAVARLTDRQDVRTN